MFEKIFDLVMKLEGGFTLHRNVTEEADTYAGIYKAAHPSWIGWTYLEEGETPPKSMVEEFYRNEYWDSINIDNDIIKGIIFETGINIGILPATKLAQQVVGVVSDGVLGPISKEAIQKYDTRKFISEYSLLRVKYYLNLVNKNPGKYSIYLRGWLNRVVSSYEWFRLV